MTTASLQLAAVDGRAIAPAFYAGPVVVIEYRQPCRLEKSELSGGVDGPLPTDVVKSLCRTLGCAPGALTFEPDPKAAHLMHQHARCYASGPLGRRVARIVGCSAAWLTVSASNLSNNNWTPPAQTPRASH